MKLTFSQFKATAPKFDDEQLTDGYAVTSNNTRPGRGILEPWKAPQNVGVSFHSGAKSIFKYNNKWFSWANVTHVVRAPLKNDPYDYCLIADGVSEPRMTTNEIAEAGTGPYPAATIPLGVPEPLAPIVLNNQNNPLWVEVSGNPNGLAPSPLPEVDEFDVSETTYAICYRDAFGRLSALSPASGSTSLKEWNFINTRQVTLTLPAIPTGLQLTNSNRGTSATVVIYRANYAGGTTSVFQFLAEVPYTDTQYVDTTFSGDLLDSPINEFWAAPPNTNTALFPNGPLKKICLMGSQTIAGHNDKLLCFAEPDAFYAFPTEYYKTFQERIVTIVPSGDSLMVLTDGYPYMVQGSHPASMDPVRLAEPVPCSSALGVTEVFGSVFYVSEVGLFEVKGYQPVNVTRNFMTDREWRALNPSTIKLANYDGRVFIDSPSTNTTYIYDPSNPSDGLRTVGINATAYAQLDETNDLAFISAGSTSITQFDADDTAFMLMQWTSKTYDFNTPEAFSVLKVKANQYPVDVTIEADSMTGVGSQTYYATLQNANFVYMPFQSRSKRWRCSVSTTNVNRLEQIRQIEIAYSPEELD